MSASAPTGLVPNAARDTLKCHPRPCPPTPRPPCPANIDLVADIIYDVDKHCETSKPRVQASLRVSAGAHPSPSDLRKAAAQAVHIAEILLAEARGRKHAR